MAKTVEEIESYLKNKIRKYCNNYLLSKGWSSTLPITYELSLIKLLDFQDILSIIDKEWRCVELPTIECQLKLGTGYKNLKKALTSGRDIEKYMSKGIYKGNSDAMFNDWGILHFHLGSQLDNTGKYIERTRELAFIKFFKETAYIIAIGNHGDWTKQKLIEELDKYAPESISHGLIGDMDISSSYSDQELGILRANNINSAIKLNNGKIYMAINSGYSLSGNKVSSSIGLTTINRYVHECAKYISDDINNLKLYDFEFYNFSWNSTPWGKVTNGIAFVNNQNRKYLYCTPRGIKYSKELV